MASTSATFSYFRAFSFLSSASPSSSSSPVPPLPPPLASAAVPIAAAPALPLPRGRPKIQKLGFQNPSTHDLISRFRFILKDSPDRAEVIPVRLREIRSKIDKKLVAQDRSKNTVSVKDVVRILKGPSKMVWIIWSSQLFARESESCSLLCSWEGSKPWRYTGKEQNMDRDDIKMVIKKWREIYHDSSLDYKPEEERKKAEAVKRKPLRSALKNAGAFTYVTAPSAA
ncbi:hypothetical protein Droror1_Dr00016840 [Drosera rotundifolia]